jgi:transposase
VVLRQKHRAGEKMFVDWAGATIPIYDRETGADQPASLFVAVLGASSYAFARATLSQDLAHWIECHVLAFEFFQGTSKLIVPDNPRTGVTRACRYEPDLNRTYLEMAQFYGVGIMPARPYKARGYRACLGIQSLAKAYSHPRLEAARRRALEGQGCSYPSLKSILKRGLDGHPTLAQEAERSGPRHENLRGGHYYQSPTKLVQ